MGQRNTFADGVVGMGLIRKVYREFSSADIYDACRLYLGTDEAWLDGRTLHACVAEAIVGGASFVQLRTRNLSTLNAIRKARSLIPVCRVANVPLVIGNDLEAAKATGVDGVHIDCASVSCAEVRSELGRDVIVGVSVQTPEQARDAEDSGASYLICGPLFAGRENRADEVVPLDVVRAVAAEVEIPVVGMGGINTGNVPELAGCGLSGVAAVSAVLAAPDIEAAARNLVREVDAYLRSERII